MAFDDRLPPDVTLRSKSPLRESDPTLGVARVGVFANPADAPPDGPALSRLVTVGDSLTHGFKSGGVAETQLAWPKLLAGCLGFPLRYPFFDAPMECPGLPFNIEAMVKRLEAHHGGRLLSLHQLLVLPEFFHLVRIVDDYWDKGAGFQTPHQPDFNENLGMYGWDLRDALSRSRGVLAQQLADRPPQPHLYRPGVADDGQIAGLRVLAGPGGPEVTQLSAAQALGTRTSPEGAGVETLVVALGANNVLPSIVQLGPPRWTQEDYADLDAKNAYTVWRPTHFANEYAQVVDAVRQVRARHVILATVPHVTIAPLARGVGTKPPGSRYWPYYTRPWTSDAEFDSSRDPHITGDDAWALDSAVDEYNDTIKQAVRQARADGLDWYLFDMCGLLDSLAFRRYLLDPTARPVGFQPYQLPPPLEALDPIPDSRFFISDNGVRVQGGLFGLDGVHPTTIGYAILAQEVLSILDLAGIPEAHGAAINFTEVLNEDTLLTSPPLSLSTDLHLLGWLQELVDWAGHLFRR
jgi:hypothetical protein